MRTETHRKPLDGEKFDVVIIGGGINGVAIARVCAAAGRKILLVEQNDFASGTTSRSTRIIHGGLRYLEHAEIGLVRESLRERELLLRSEPHLVRPLSFMLALPEGKRYSALEIRFGLWLYRRFARAGRPAQNGRLAEVDRLLDSGTKWSVFQYDDAQCEFPERLTAEWLTDAVASGAVARNYTEALSIEVTDQRVRGLRMRDRLSAAEFRVDSQWIINASGPWADRVAHRAGLSDLRMVGGVRGSHIVVPRFAGAPDSALYTEALDRRPIFVVPWNGELLVGTTEVSDSGNPGNAQPSNPEIEYLLNSFNRLFPAAAIGRDRIRYAMAGVRPLPYSPSNPLAAITRRHLLRDHRDDGAQGMISLIGGKLTTAGSVARECARMIGIDVPEPRHATVVNSLDLKMALNSDADAIDAAISPDATKAVKSWFGRSAPEILRLAAADDELRKPICDRSPHIIAEAVYAMNKECAVTLADLLLRRVPIALSGAWSEQQTRPAAERIGAAIGWSQDRIRCQVEQFEEERQSFLVKASATTTA